MPSFVGYACVACVLTAALPLASQPAQAQSASSAKTYTLAGVSVTGTKKFTRDQVVAASGLRIGQQIDLGAVDAAADACSNPVQ
jgi:hypothetical protein